MGEDWCLHWVENDLFTFKTEWCGTSKYRACAELRKFQKKFTLSIMSPAIKVLEGWDISHLKGWIHRSVFQGLSCRTIKHNLKHAKQAGLSWPKRSTAWISYLLAWLSTAYSTPNENHCKANLVQLGVDLGAWLRLNMQTFFFGGGGSG